MTTRYTNVFEKRLNNIFHAHSSSLLRKLYRLLTEQPYCFAIIVFTVEAIEARHEK